MPWRSSEFEEDITESGEVPEFVRGNPIDFYGSMTHFQVISHEEHQTFEKRTGAIALSYSPCSSIRRLRD